MCIGLSLSSLSVVAQLELTTDINSKPGPGSSLPSLLTDVGGKLLFFADDGENGRALWCYEGAVARLVKEFDPLSTGDFSVMTNLNGLAFFGDGRQTWRSDGTSVGTVPFDIGVGAMEWNGESDHKAPGYEVVGNLLYYGGKTPGVGRELWVTDGTVRGSRLVKDLSRGSGGSNLYEMEAVGSLVYFPHGNGLWRSDGRSGGTWPVASFRLGVDLDDQGVGAGWLTSAGNGVYFITSGMSEGRKLYASNGTGKGAVLLHDPAALYSGITLATALLPDRSLLYPVKKLDGTFDLWRSNGTKEGTFKVKSIGVSDVWNFGDEGVVIGGFWYFGAKGESGDLELWRSNGTSSGTTRFAVVSGAERGDRLLGSVVNGTLYFPISVSGSNRLWKTDGTQAGTMEVDDRVRDIGGIVLSGEDLFVRGKRSDVGVELFKLDNVRPAPFAITGGPTGQTVALGGRLSLSASVTSAVGLKFKWRKDGIAIPGATGLRFTSEKVNEFDEGRYDLLIRQGNYEVLTNAAEVEVDDPIRLLIVQQPQSKLAAVGGSAEFEVESVGAGPVTAQWFKGNKAIPGATGLTLSLPNVVMADAGGYRVVLKNRLGSVTSAMAELGVVDTSDRFVGAKLNSPVTIKAPVAGRGMQFVWDEGQIGSSLTISKVEQAGSDGNWYSYRCLVRMGNQELSTGDQIVKVASVPLVTGAALLPDWSISEWVNWPVSALLSQSNLVGAAWNAPTSFSVSGLPKGLRYDPVTMRIVGRPIAGGGGSVTIKIKATNAAGTSVEVSVVIDIIALPALAAGEYRGLVDRNGAINGLLGNGLQVTVTELGGISGRLAQGTVALGFQGVLNTTAGLSQATANLSIPRKGAVPLQLNLNLNGATGVLTGSVTDGTATANATLVRCPWNKTNLASDYAAAYTGVFQLQAGQVGDVDYPQGEATLTATVSTVGMVSGAVRFADGVRTTFSVLLGGQGECALYLPGYGNTGSLRGFGTIASSNGFLDGTVTFYKAAQVATSSTRSYKGGVPEHTLTLVGGEWVRPTASVLLLGVTDSGAAVAAENAKVTFTSGGIESSGLSVSGAYLEQVRIKAPTSGFVLPSGAGNPGGLKLSLNASTGEISGEFSTSDENPLISGRMIPRKAPFFGVIVQRLNQGRGHFNLAKLPAAAPEETDPVKTRVLSGLVKLEVLP